MKLTFQLTSVARKAGGDRYEADVEGEDRPMVIYVPQVISRKSGRAVMEIDVTLKLKGGAYVR